MALRHDIRDASRSLRGQALAELLGGWQHAELRRASRFRECAGLTWEDLEDLYQDSALVLLGREFESEQHLRWALHEALKHRALNTHRDRTRHAQIAEHAHTGERALQRAAELEQSSDRPLLAQQDQFIVREFLSELTEQEQQLFRLLADGHGWRAAADALGAPRNEIRAAARSCERKRERFALLYTTGRLCGYRAHTIQALTAGETDSATLARRAHAHLQSCARCRIEHGTNGERFRRLFDRDALALLPLPALVQRLPWFSRTAARANRAAQHLASIFTSGGASAKLAVGAASIAVAAGGTIGATQALSHHTHPTTRRQQATASPRRPASGIERPLTSARTPAATTRRPHKSPMRKALRIATRTTTTTANTTSATTTSTTPTTPATSAAPLTPAATATGGQAGASGFAYLGVPHSTAPSSSTLHQTSSGSGQGGLFSP